jgi:hypothetical protein
VGILQLKEGLKMPCEICNRKSEEIRDILRPFNLHLVEPVCGVKILAEWFLGARESIKEMEDQRDNAIELKKQAVVEMNSALVGAKEAEAKLAAFNRALNITIDTVNDINRACI